MYGPMAAYLSELFGTRVRYSGASLVYQLTSIFSGGLAPFIATLALARYGYARRGRLRGGLLRAHGRGDLVRARDTSGEAGRNAGRSGLTGAPP